MDYRKYGIFLLSSSNGFSVDCKDGDLFDDKILNELFGNFDGVNLSDGSFSRCNNGGEKYIVIPSWKNPRWFVPCNKNSIRNVGNLIKPTSLKAKTVWKFARIFNCFNCIDFVFRKHIYIKSSNLQKRFIKSDSIQNTYVIYTGAPGIYQKFTIQEMTSTGQICAFYKFGCNSHSQERIHLEKEALGLLNQYSFLSFKHPQLLDYYDVEKFRIIKQSPCESSYKGMILEFNELHRIVLAELDSKSKTKKKKDLVINNLKVKSEHINAEGKLSIIGAIKGNLSNAIDLLANGLVKYHDLELSFSHGDFTPWNIFTDGDQLFIFDWEMAESRLQLWDFFNFIYHQYILTGNFSLENIDKEIIANRRWAMTIVETEIYFKVCHLYFLTDILIHYTEHFIKISESEPNNNLKELVTKFNNSLKHCIENNK